MKELIKEKIDFIKTEASFTDALKFYKNAPYKTELVNDVKKKGEKKASFFDSGNFHNLCKGPHVKNTKEIDPKAFKLTKLAGAYWRGDEKNKMLTRIYGVAFNTKKELDKYLRLKEEQLKRDHRKIGKELELFTFSEEVGAGLPLWLPQGMIIRQELEKWGIETEKEWGYKHVATPFLTRRKLFEISGHVPYFEDEMYKVQIPGEEKEEYFIRPMNCPFHHMIYKHKKRSYRELPLRIAEYGTVARYEQAGTLNGILRPRIFTQNDAHIYCTQEQAVDMFVEIIDLHRYYYDALGLKDYYIVLALRDPMKKDKYHGNEKMWKKSKELSIKAMDKAGIKYIIENEGAAHYGPKMDFKIKSAIGTEYGISTNQIDLYMPERFNLKYIDQKGREKYVIVQHRAPLGSSERFVAFLIEHFAGAFPVWLSPVQVKIISVGSDHKKYCHQLANEFREDDIRVEVDDVNETVGNKIRKASKEKVPYMLVIGDKEIKLKQLAVRERGKDKVNKISKDKFIKQIKKEIKDKK